MLPGLRKGRSSTLESKATFDARPQAAGICVPRHLSEVDLKAPEAKLRHFKKQAKALLKGVHAADRFWLSQARIHPRFPDQLEVCDFKLSDAQLVIARQQGFASWTRLKASAESLRTQTGDLPMKMNYLTPELPVPNIADAVAALEPIGFRKAWEYEDNFACMFGGGNIEIYLRREDEIHPVTMYLKVDDADSFYDVCRKHAELVEPIRNTPWGMREFAIRTVGGHVLRIGHGEPEGGDRRQMNKS